MKEQRSGPVGDLAAAMDSQRFVGRTEALDQVGAALDGHSDVRIFHVSGPAGVGKSAFARAAARCAAETGHHVATLDGRVIPVDPDRFPALLAPATTPGTLLVVDEIDEVASVRFALRSALVQALDASSVVLLIGRRKPDRDWFEDGLDHISDEIELRPLDAATSLELLDRHGVVDAAERDRMQHWAQGFPLALTLAAAMRRDADEPTGWERGDVAEDRDLADAIVARLGAGEIAGVDLDVLDVAGVAAVVDRRLLEAALPGQPVRAGWRQLQDLSTAERVGTRLAVHRLLRTALRSRLRETDPDRYRTLALRIAEHLRVRVLTEDPRLLLELADLVEEPQLRLAFDASPAYYADRCRARDLALLDRTFDPGAGWFQRLRRWCTDLPEVVLVVRRVAGDAVALMVFCPAERLPAWADECIEVDEPIRYARAEGHVADCVFVHTIVFLDPTVEERGDVAEVIQVGNSGAFTRGLVRYHRIAYVTDHVRRDGDGSEFLGYQEVTSLRRADGDRQLFTLVRDFGPDGLVGVVCDIIRAEQQADDLAGSLLGADLVAALRAFHDDEALRSSPLGEDPDAIRGVVRDAIDRAFGDDEGDRRLSDALLRAYVDPDGGHARARQDLHMSRSSFYRHLQRARQRLADCGPAT